MAHVSWRPSVGSIAAVALAGIIVAAGPTLAHLSTGKAAQPLATHPAVQVLGVKTLKLAGATGGGQVKSLITSGPIAQRAICINQGGGQFLAEIQIKSTAAGAMELSSAGWIPLTSSYQTNWSASGTAAVGFGETYDVITSSAHFHYHADFAVHSFGANCYIRLASLSD